MRALLVVLAFGAAACASVPPAPGRPDVASELTGRTGVDAGDLAAPDGARTVPAGVTLDGGVSMNEAAAIALWNNADFHAALASLGFARADLVEAGLIRNPILSLLFPVGPKQLEWTLSWPIDVLWQRPRRIQAASLAADVVAKQLVAHGLRLVADVKLAWVDAEAAGRRARYATERAARAEQLASLAQGRLRAGDISEFEARLAETDAAQMEAARIAQSSARDLAMLRLRTLMGLGPETHPNLSLQASGTAGPQGSLDIAPCGAVPALVETALAARPEVRAAELGIEAAGARIGLAKARIMTFTATLDARQAERVLGAALGASLAMQAQQAERLHEAGEISRLTLLDTRQRLDDAGLTQLEAAAAARRALIGLEEAIGGPCGSRR